MDKGLGNVMNRVKYFWGFLILTICLLQTSCATYLAQKTQVYMEQKHSSAYALVGGNIISIKKPGVIADQTILIQEGKIKLIGPRNSIPIPPDFKRINIQGKYLIPGLSDMHVHLSDERDLLFYLKYGVTSIRNMADNPWWSQLIGFPDVRTLRKKVRHHQLLGPDIFTCGALLDGSPPQFPLNQAISSHYQAEQVVKESVEAGYDCIKIYNLLAREHFETIIKTAKRYHIPVMGHVPFDVGLARALEAPVKTIEHLNAYVENFAAHYRFSETELREYAVKTRQAGVFNCPTLVVWELHPPEENYTAFLKEDVHYPRVAHHLKMFWDQSVPYLFRRVTYHDKKTYPGVVLELSKKMIKMLYEAGAPLLIGADANLPGIHPGSSVLREMELFSEAGIPNHAILEAATLNAAKAMGKEQVSGSIKVGKIADIVVLEKNPLRDIKHIRSTFGVIRRGKWLSRQYIEQIIDDL